MTKELKVKDSPGLVRDVYSKAILNTDKAALIEHRRRLSLGNNIESINQEVNELKKDIEEIKSMLTLLLKK